MTTLNKDGTPRKNSAQPGNRRRRIPKPRKLTNCEIKRYCPTLWETVEADKIPPQTLLPDALRQIMVTLWHLGFQESSNLDVTPEILDRAEVFLKEKLGLENPPEPL